MVVNSINQKLFFTSSGSSVLRDQFSFTGLYSCRLGDYASNDDDYEDAGGYCVDPRTVADSYGQDMNLPYELDLPLLNLNLYASSKKIKNETISKQSLNEKTSASGNDDGGNYLYGTTFVEHKKYQRNTWELLRADISNSANIDKSSADGGDRLLFHEYFRTLSEFDFNNCNFDCCPFKDGKDSNGYQAHRERHDSQFLHSYVRTSPRAFAVDSQTGDIFITWEGFYKNCNPVDIFYASKMLEWTIGISRLKTREEDPTCILVKKENGEYKGIDDLEVNFPRCTEPVAILFKGTQGHEVLLPYGGFSVIPAAPSLETENQQAKSDPGDSTKNRRSFLLTALRPGKGEAQSHLWAITEGGDVTRKDYMRQEVITNGVRGRYMKSGVWDGGNQKLHYNQQTGRPDHLCHTVFDKGIECMQISVTEDQNSVYVKVVSEPEIFLREEQVTEFCAPVREAKVESGQVYFAETSTLVTGLDVLWDDSNGTPERIFFGCYGQQSDGKLGSVDRGGTNLREMLKGAYAGDVLLLPRELDQMQGLVDNPHDFSSGSINAEHQRISSSRSVGVKSTAERHKISSSKFVTIATAAFFLSCIAYFYKRRRSPLWKSMNPMKVGNNRHDELRDFSATYMELPALGSSETQNYSNGSV